MHCQMEIWKHVFGYMALERVGSNSVVGCFMLTTASRVAVIDNNGSLGDGQSG